MGDIEDWVGRIHLGDCLEVMPNIPSQSVDMILCDLPYGTTQNKWDSVIPLDKLWEQYLRIAKPNAAIVLTAQTPFDKVLGYSNISMLKYEWIWEKTHPSGHLNANKAPMKAHENVLVFYGSLPTYNPQKTRGHVRKTVTSAQKAKTPSGGNSSNYGKEKPTSYSSTERFPRSVQKFALDKQHRLAVHPTQKPVALFEYLIATYTNLNDVVLDNCIGSGTTAEAATVSGRQWVGIESNSEYVDIANKRLAPFGWLVNG